MADGIYVGMAGAVARAAQLESIADNLANAQTPGFKASRPAFESFLPEGVGPEGDKVFTAAVSSPIDLRPGPIVHTGERLDVVPEGDAFFSVQLEGGQVAFTRNGHMKVDTAGRLVSGGYPVLGKSGLPIQVPPGAMPEIQRDGSVTLQGQPLDELSLVTLEGPIQRLGPSLLAPDVGGVALTSTQSVRVGEMEMGNAPALEAAVQMISAQRHYETSTQALQTYKRLDERASEVGRVR